MRKADVQFVFVNGERPQSPCGSTGVEQDEEVCAGTRSRKAILHLGDLVASAWHWRNRDSCSGTQFPTVAQIWVFPAVCTTLQASGSGDRDPQHPRGAEDRPVGLTASCCDPGE